MRYFNLSNLLCLTLPAVVFFGASLIRADDSESKLAVDVEDHDSWRLTDHGALASIEAVPEAVPSEYDGRDVDGQRYVTQNDDVPGENNYWCFAATSAMEANMLLTGVWNSYGSWIDLILSAWHMDYWNGFNDFNNDDVVPPTGGGLPLDGGGDYLMASAYLSRGEGATEYSVLQWSGWGISGDIIRYQDWYTYWCPRTIEWINESSAVDQESKIKTAIMSYGAVASSLYFDPEFTDPPGLFWEQFGQRVTYYSPPGSSFGPDVYLTIVGWNDTLTTQAPYAGAWLCQSAFGSRWAQQGFFWVSYYDEWIGRHSETGAVVFRGLELVGDRNVYYHDYHGWRDTKTDCNRVFNAFIAEDFYSLAAVSFFAAADNVDYTVKVFDRFENGELADELYSVAGTVPGRAGFHTIDLETEVAFYPSDDFYIYLELSEGGQPYDRTSSVLGAEVVSEAEPGQSYYWDGSAWQDLHDLDATANFCVKGIAKPNVIKTENSVGTSPLPVTFWVDIPEEDIQLLKWDFGNGAISYNRSPVFSYSAPGIHQVKVDLWTWDRNYTSIDLGSVAVLADTVDFAQAVPGPNGTARVDVYARNTVRLTDFTFPFAWAGPLDVTFDSVAKHGTRSEDFEYVAIFGLNTVDKIGSLSGKTKKGTYLEPGAGSLFSLYFTVPGGDWQEENPIEVHDYHHYALEFVSHYGTTRPVVASEIVSVDCCEDRVGDANGLGGDEPTIGDVSVLIDAKFITGTCDGILACLTEADINQSGGLNAICDDITIGDISVLIDYLFITGPSLGLPGCL